MTSKERYYYRKKNGLCVNCGNTAQDGSVFCQKCHDHRLEYQREARELYRKAGLCKCGRERFGNLKSCEYCLEKKASTSISPFYHRNKSKESYIRKKEMGICVRCSLPAVNGLVLCAKHHKEAIIKGRRQYYKNKIYSTGPSIHHQWALDGRCYLCGSDNMHVGKKLCNSCYAKSLINIKKAQEASPAKDYVRMNWNNARNIYIQRHGHPKYNDNGTLWEKTHETN